MQDIVSPNSDGFDDMDDVYGGETEYDHNANIEAERALLGSLMIDSNKMTQIENSIKPDDFYLEKHRYIFEAMVSIHQHGRPLDFVLLVEELERRDWEDKVGGWAYVAGLPAVTPTSLNAEHYAHVIKERSALRRLAAVGVRIVQLAHEGGDNTEAILDQAEQLVFSVANTSQQLHSGVTLSDAMDAAVAAIELAAQTKGSIGIPTGFKLLDHILGGLQRTDFTIIAARPGMGKSSFAASIALNASRLHNARVAFFSLEMSTEQMSQRLLSMQSGVDAHRLRIGRLSDEEWGAIIDAANELSQSTIVLDDTPALTITALRARARRIAAEHGLDLLIVDYLQLMRGDDRGSRENRQLEVSSISRELKALAKELNVPVLALSQLSRAVEQRADKRPMLSDLRESGSLEQDADSVMFLYREDYYVEDSDRQNIADVIIAKHRHGSTGNVSLYFRKELTQFRDLELERRDLIY